MYVCIVRVCTHEEVFFGLATSVMSLTNGDEVGLEQCRIVYGVDDIVECRHDVQAVRLEFLVGRQLLERYVLEVRKDLLVFRVLFQVAAQS